MKVSKLIGMLLIFSLFVNVGFWYILKTQSVSDVVINQDDNFMNAVYDLNNYKSTSYESKNLEQRFSRLYEEYNKDKKIPREEYYLDGKIDPYWKRKCVNSLRRITIITAKLEVIEKVLNIAVSNDEKAKQEVDILIEQKGYHEKLMDMSNFYAQFVSEEIYSVIQTTLD